MENDAKEYWNAWANQCRRDLTEDIMPFWLKHGWDREHGGVYTCVDRDGTLMDPTKSGWFQGRFAFVCSYAYNTVARTEEWLAAAKSTLDFIDAHLFDKRGKAYFSLMADGTPVRMRRYVSCEGFAAIAMSEYAKATGSDEYAAKALALFNRIRSFIGDPAIMPPKFEPGIRMMGHALAMCFINVALRIKEVSDDPVLDLQIRDSIEKIRTKFIHPEFKALLETVGPDGEFIDTMMGRKINPGHAIESSWFLMNVFEKTRDAETLALALQILEWSIEWGWDKEYGGIINFRDCRNFPPQSYEQDMKFWWPQCETLIATQYAWNLTGDLKWLEWHRKVREWTYARMPDPAFGEWYGYLHRDGTVAQPAKGNLFKGPFHIPRMMVKSIDLARSANA